MKVFSGSSNKPLAEKVARNLNLKLSELEIHTFPDGEKRIQIKENLVEQDAVLIESTNPPVNLNYMELFLIADTIKGNGAKNLTLVCPYLGYQRQDHVFREGEGVTFKTMVKLIESVGVDKLITFDLHTIKIPEFFKIPVLHLSALPLFAAKIRELSKGIGIASSIDKRQTSNDTGSQTQNVILVSPDMGGIRKVKELSKLLFGVPFAVINKNRDLQTGKIKLTGIEGDVRGKKAIVLDDMISTGKTVAEAAILLRENGAMEVYVFATHAVFSKGAHELLQKSPIEKIYVTDTIDVPKEKYFAKLEVISILDLISKELE